MFIFLEKIKVLRQNIKASLKKDSIISLLGKTSLEEAAYILSIVDLVDHK